MKIKKKSGYVPNLRFPGFQRKEEWQEKVISDLFNQKRKPVKVSDFNKEKVITVRLHTNGVVKNERNVTLTGGANYFIRHSGQFVFSKIDLLNGAFGLIPPELDGFCTSSDVPAFFFKQEESALFFINWLKASYQKIKIERTGTSSTLKRISIDKFLDISIPLPDIQEQQKIADCLSSLDNVISLQTQKIDALQQYKKGLMQKLFPAEGETVPELRFGGFKQQAKWEKRQLGEIAKFSSGGTPSKDIPDYWNGTIPWISASSMYSTKLNKSALYVTKLAIGNGTRIAKKGSLLILVRGSMLFNRIPMGIADIDVAFNQDVKSLSIDKKMNAIFLLNQLMAFESRIAINETGIGAGKIETEDLKRLNVYMPSISEQQKIADCLSSLDELMTNETQKLTALKIHKTGLMQQLFPSMDEVKA